MNAKLARLYSKYGHGERLYVPRRDRFGLIGMEGIPMSDRRALATLLDAGLIALGMVSPIDFRYHILGALPAVTPILSDTDWCAELP